MKRILASIALSVLGFSNHAFAIAGGPFDNGSFSSSLEGGGYYQAILSFVNGSGYMTFSPEARIALIQSTDVPTRASMINRSVLYYKGVTYVGAAFGTIDNDASYVQGELNGSSDVSNATTQTTQQAGFFNFSASTTSVSTSVTASNRSFTVNGNFEARITQTSPLLKFKGKGELSFISPSGADSVAGLAFTGYQGLINAINQSLSNDIIAPDYAGAQNAIDAALLALPKHLAGAGLDATYAGADVRKMKVRGTHRYMTNAPAVTSN